MKTHIINKLLVIGLSIFILSACSEDEVIVYQLNSELVELKCDKTFALQVTPALQGLHYTSLNTNIATVSADGLIKAKLVGTTQIVVKDSLNKFVDTVKVAVSSQYNAYTDPYLGFGATKDDVLKIVDDPKYTYYYYAYESYNLMYLYDSNETSGEYTYYEYYFSKENKLLFSEIYKLDYGDVEWHLSTRYNLMRNFKYSETYYDSYDSTYYTYNYNQFYYINPDSSMIVYQPKSSGSYASVYFFPANKELIDRILRTDNNHGEELYTWFIYSFLYPNVYVNPDFVMPKRRPDISTKMLVPPFKRP